MMIRISLAIALLFTEPYFFSSKVCRIPASKTVLHLIDGNSRESCFRAIFVEAPQPIKAEALRLAKSLPVRGVKAKGGS